MARIRSMWCIEPRRRFALVVWSSMAASLSVGCGPATQPDARLDSIRAADAGIEIRFDRAAPLEQVDVLDSEGGRLQASPVAPGRRTYHVPFRWHSNGDYHVLLHLPGNTLRETIHAPDRPAPLRAVVEMPLGQQTWELGSVESAAVILPPSGELTVGFVIESRRQTPARYRMATMLPDGVTLAGDDERLKRDESTLVMDGVLEIESDFVQVVANLTLTGQAAEPIRFRFEQWTVDEDGTQQSWEVDFLSVHVRRATTPELAMMVHRGEAVFPADAAGRAQPEQLADTVVLPNPVWSALRGWLRPRGRLFSYYEPYASQSLELTNRADLPLNLVIRSEVVDPSSGEALLDFAPPAWLTLRQSPTADHLLRLEPGESAAAAMPLYVRPEVRPGSYQRRLRVYLVGSNEPLIQIQRPLEVVRGDPVVSVVVLAAIGLSLVGWTYMALRGRKMLANIGTEGLTQIGMIGSLHFVVSYAARIGGDVLAGVTGPFYIFVAGVANEGIACLLLAVVVTLVPRVGVWTLSSLTVFLLNAMFTGQFGLVDLLFVTVSIILGEAALALLGVTTRARLRGARTRPTFSIVARVALAIGISNAATLYVQYCLIQVLHRLFFAAWYVAGVSIITGLIYGGLGAAMGTLLGYQLRRTVR